MPRHNWEEREGQGSVDGELCAERVWASIRYDDDAMISAARGCCCCCCCCGCCGASIILTSAIRCFKSLSTSAISLPPTRVSEAVGSGFFSPASLLLSSLGGSLILPLMGVISVTARVLLEFEELMRPLKGRSRAFNVLKENETEKEKEKEKKKGKEKEKESDKGENGGVN